jgi:CBS domain containing-hemolysin-like protein
MQAEGEMKNYALMRAACCWALAKFCFLLDVCPLQLASRHAEKLARTGLQFLETYMWLAKHCINNHVCMYAVKPKLHQPGS